LEQLVKQIANEYSQNDICANAIALATMMTNAELNLKPFGDHQHWLKPEEVAEFVVSMIRADTRILNGNVHDLFHYSDSYFHDSYFQRVQGDKGEKDV
jgi:NAD(P)-dependent dehydrogenase (short-subunit alcohol dehydrogenase family)